MTILAACFDLDKTIVDCDAFNFALTAGAARRNGGILTREEWDAHTGQAPAFFWSLLREKHKGFTVSENDFILDCRNTAGLSEKFSAKAYPGAIGLTAYYEQRRLRSAIVTTAPRVLAKFYIEAIGGVPGIDKMITQDDVHEAGKQLKPHPDPYLMAAELLRVNPPNCVAFEDSYSGVRSAVDAGMIVVHIQHDGIRRSSPAHYVVHTQEELLSLGCKLVP